MHKLRLVASNKSQVLGTVNGCVCILFYVLRNLRLAFRFAQVGLGRVAESC